MARMLERLLDRCSIRGSDSSGRPCSWHLPGRRSAVSSLSSIAAVLAASLFSSPSEAQYSSFSYSNGRSAVSASVFGNSFSLSRFSPNGSFWISSFNSLYPYYSGSYYSNSYYSGYSPYYPYGRSFIFVPSQRFSAGNAAASSPITGVFNRGYCRQKDKPVAGSAAKKKLHVNKKEEITTERVRRAAETADNPVVLPSRVEGRGTGNLTQYVHDPVYGKLRELFKDKLDSGYELSPIRDFLKMFPGSAGSFRAAGLPDLSVNNEGIYCLWDKEHHQKAPDDPIPSWLVVHKGSDIESILDNITVRSGSTSGSMFYFRYE